MARSYYFLLTSLPGLPELGEPPPMPLREFRARVLDEPSLAPSVDALLLEHDLLTRQAALAGEVRLPEGVVLSDGQVAGEEPLPEFLIDPARPGRRIPSDLTWEAYFRYLHKMGAGSGSKFLRRWAGFEVGLRNALALARARTLGLDALEYLVAPEISDPNAEAITNEAVAAWQQAAEPLAALRALDQRRRRWIDDNAGYFTFAADEVLAYAAKLMLVDRWRRIARGPADDAGEAAPSAAKDEHAP